MFFSARFLFLFLFVNAGLQAQHNFDIWGVELTDKFYTAHTLLRPHEFLSARALERREKQKIQLHETDLPISEAYISQIQAFGAGIHARSKWLNMVAIYAPDSLTRAKILSLGFVRRIIPLGYSRRSSAPVLYPRAVRDTMNPQPYYQGKAYNQHAMLQLPPLHTFGYTGQEMQIAVLDGGFGNLYRMPAFDSLNQRGQLLGTYDLVENDNFVYEDGEHGTDALSMIASNMPYRLVGSAPEANFYLFKTENTKGEFWLEEFSYVVAAETADSLGADLLHASLGYTVFRDSTMNYTYQDLNGHKSLATRGADIATDKGMLVINSAGNEGKGKWHYISVPADGFNVIAVGAVTSQDRHAKFSSYGHTPDGRIKPNLCAQGQEAYAASPLGYSAKLISGTSFSAPLLAGAISCLWQACPESTNFELKASLEQTASHAETPDTAYGYGIPRLLDAYLSLQKETVCIITPNEDFSNGYPFQNQLKILFQTADRSDLIQARVILSDKYGHYKRVVNKILTDSDVHQISLDTENLEAGVYSLEVVTDWGRCIQTVAKF